MINLDSLPMSELLALYNGKAAELEQKFVKRFADRKTALRRTHDIIREHAAVFSDTPPAERTTELGSVAPKPVAKAAEVVAPKPVAKAAKVVALKPGAKAARPSAQFTDRMSFNNPPTGRAIKPPKGETSLRARVFIALRSGVTFRDIVRVVVDFDAERGKGNAATVERRAYKLIRAMNLKLGMGLSQDNDGYIRVYGY
jgi:hypothetical protein